MADSSIRFYYRGKVHEVNNQATTRTVLQHLREDLACMGTKEGCAEGDCGACTVVVAQTDANGKLEMRAVNSCIQFLPTLDGKALYTVEDLRQDQALHPVQQALVDHHGSQCGFCTPGFVMSMWGMYLNHEPEQINRALINESLSGNLCRCTGYRPIIKACEEMFNYPRVNFDTVKLEKTLSELKRTDTFRYEYDDHIFHAPQTLQQLAQLRLQYPDARLLAGSTDVGLWVTKQYRDLKHLIYIGQVAELRAIHSSEDQLHIGAGALLNDAFAALVQHIPELEELHQRFASHPIRNAGTLGGNVANGSPIGDAMPALIALGTNVVLQKGDCSRTIPLEQLYLAYQKNDIQAGEFLKAVVVPIKQASRQFRTYKLSKRFDQDISAVCAAFSITLDENDYVTAIRTGFGGVAAVPARARQTEELLLGKRWNLENVQAAMAQLAAEFQPLTDMRASSSYRTKALQNLLYRFYLETNPAHALNTLAVSSLAFANRRPE